MQVGFSLQSSTIISEPLDTVCFITNPHLLYWPGMFDGESTARSWSQGSQALSTQCIHYDPS